MYVICGTVIAHDPKMCPIVFGSDVMHINEGAGLYVKILKCSYLHNHKTVWLHIKLGYVVSKRVHVYAVKSPNLIDMHSGRGLI